MAEPHVFARRVTYIREQRGWTQQELAKRAETSYQTIWRIERGLHKEPGIYLAARIARALGVTVDYLVGMYSESELEAAVEALASTKDLDGSTAPFAEHSRPIMAHAGKE